MADDKQTKKGFVQGFLDGLMNKEGPVTLGEGLKNKIKGMLKDKDELVGSLSERELDILLNRYKEKGNKRKDPKPKKDPVTGAEYLYAKKGGLVKKSKVAGRLAKRGYGRAMKGKK